MSVSLQLKLKDENERLKTRLDGMQNKFGSMAHTKTDLSQQLLMTEEEKLKVRVGTGKQGIIELSIFEFIYNHACYLVEEKNCTKF